MSDLGAVFLPQQPPELLRETAQAADQAGLRQLWLWEDCFRESGVATAAAALAWTSQLRVGVGLLPVPLRNVALTGMEVATLLRLFPGRLELAVGHGVQDWMGQVGARVDSPMTLLAEYLDALTALLAGRSVTTAGRYVQLTDVALDWPPPVPPRLLVGAIGTRTLQLAGRAAAGTVMVGGTTPDQLRAARETMLAARDPAGARNPADADGGRRPDPVVVVHLITATGPDADQRLAAELAHWPVEGGPDTAVAGTAEQVAAAVSRWAAAGADTVVLQPTADADPREFVRFAGEQVQPLLS